MKAVLWGLLFSCCVSMTARADDLALELADLIGGKAQYQLLSHQVLGEMIRKQPAMAYQGSHSELGPAVSDLDSDARRAAQTYHSHFTQREIQDMVLFFRTSQRVKVCALYAIAARRDGADWSAAGPRAAASVDSDVARCRSASPSANTPAYCSSLRSQWRTRSTLTPPEDGEPPALADLNHYAVNAQHFLYLRPLPQGQGILGLSLNAAGAGKKRPSV